MTDESAVGGKGVGRIAREEILRGRIFDIHRDTVRFPDGSTGRLELLEHPGASAVLPFLDPPSDPDPRVVLIHQYRYAAGGSIYEVPAGIPEGPDEPWDLCARRELLEEAGYVAGTLRYLTRILTTPGFTDEVIHLFAATDLQPGKIDRDADEFLEVVIMPFSEALAMVRRGEIIDGKSVCALLFFAAFVGEGWIEDPSRVSSG